MLHKVGEAVLPMSLSASMSPMTDVRLYIPGNLDAVATALHNARFGGARKG